MLLDSLEVTTTTEKTQKRILIISDTLPFSFDSERGKLLPRNDHAAYWVGANCKSIFDKVVYIGKPSNQHQNVDKSALAIYSSQNCIPVILDKKIARGHWDGYCRTILWPLIHYQVNDIPNLNNHWDDYLAVNEAFCQEIISIWEPEDIVWILDYHLLCLAGLLKERIFNLSLGLYLRCPFPSSEVFRCLPSNNLVF